MSANSLRWRISAALLAALEAAPELRGVVVLDNPRDAQAIRRGSRIVFLEDQADTFIDQASQQGRRRYQFALGAINRTPADRCGADADYTAAEAVVRAAHGQLLRDLRCGPLRETDLQFRVEGLDVGGALVLGMWEIEYLKPRPA